MATQRFSAQFKREAVRLLETSDKPITQLALELGVPRNRLYKWRDTLRSQGDGAFPGSGYRSLEQLEIARLKRELADAREENAILKQRRRTSPANPHEARLDPRATDESPALLAVPLPAGFLQWLSRVARTFTMPPSHAGRAARCDLPVGCSSGASLEDGGYQAKPALRSPG